MSLLMFQATPDEVSIVSDGITVRDGAPHHFASKAVPVPHLGVVIAGVGATGIVASWIRHAAFDLLASGIDDLAPLAEALLPRLAAGAGDGHTAIYHFGISKSVGHYVCDEFDSSTGFRRERHAEGRYYVRPDPRSEPRALPADLAGWVPFIHRLRADWAAAPADERIELGGNIDAIAMTGGRIIVVPGFARFDDADEMFERMRLAALQRSERQGST